MTPAIDITPEQRKTLLAFFHRFIPGVEVWAYGSRVKWTARPNSDLDLVVFADPPQRRLVSELKEALDESNLPFPVDVHVWDEVPERFHAIIREEYVVLQEPALSKKQKAMNEWQEVPLSELADLSGGFAFKSQDYAPTGRFILRTLNIRDDCSISHNDAVYLPEELVPQYKRFELQPDDTLFVMVGATLGKVGFVRERDLPALLNQNMWLVRAKKEVADPRFVHYAFRNAVKASLGWASGSARDFVRRDDYRNLQILAPGIDEQRAIAHILGTLDDKIELNRRMNETLEAMAQALFKSWFVDFDPVRAKAEGRWRRGQSLPGLPAELYDLFPDSLEDSELGEIPKGWEVGRFGDVVEQLRDQENPLSSPDILFHHYSLPSFDDGQTPKLECGENIKSLKSRVPAGTILLSKLNPEIERVWMVDVRLDERAVCSTEFLVLRARPPFGRNYAYCLARSPIFRQQIEGLVTGTSKSHQRAQVDSILNIEVVIPPSPLIAAFERSAANLLERTLVCRRESHTFAALRDALLPKLISGELRIKDAEEFLEHIKSTTVRRLG
jgi:type I restriction enzyme S subunit